MRNVFLVLLIVGFVWLVVGVISCSDNCETGTVAARESAYERMGRLHNEGLDYVFDRILAHAPCTKSGGRELPAEDEIRQLCREFATAQGERLAGGQVGTDADTVEDFSFLSSGQREWLARVQTLVWDVTPDGVDGWSDEMECLEKQLQEDGCLPESEKKTLLYVMAVCRSSAVYWAENHERWQVELYGVEAMVTQIHTRGEGKRVPAAWWEKYKHIVWEDGVGGIRQKDGSYWLEDATVASISVFLKNITGK